MYSAFLLTKDWCTRPWFATWPTSGLVPPIRCGGAKLEAAAKNRGAKRVPAEPESARAGRHIGEAVASFSDHTPATIVRGSRSRCGGWRFAARSRLAPERKAFG